MSPSKSTLGRKDDWRKLFFIDFLLYAMGLFSNYGSSCWIGPKLWSITQSIFFSSMVRNCAVDRKCSGGIFEFFMGPRKRGDVLTRKSSRLRADFPGPRVYPRKWLQNVGLVYPITHPPPESRFYFSSSSSALEHYWRPNAHSLPSNRHVPLKKLSGNKCRLSSRALVAYSDLFGIIFVCFSR